MISKRLGVLVCTAALLATGCEMHQSQEQHDQQLQQQAARATENAKRDARIAAADAKVAAAHAAHNLGVIASGVREGWKNGKPAPVRGEPVDLNSATESQLAALPGITRARARRIIRGRPYASVHDLVKKGILSKAQLDRISGEVTIR